MKVITIESKAFQNLSERFDRIEAALDGAKTSEIKHADLLNSSDVCNYLKISRRTLARLTSLGELSYTKSGRKLLFRPSDIETFLEKNRKGGWG